MNLLKVLLKGVQPDAQLLPLALDLLHLLIGLRLRLKRIFRHQVAHTQLGAFTTLNQVPALNLFRVSIAFTATPSTSSSASAKAIVLIGVKTSFLSIWRTIVRECTAARRASRLR
jgi:hypothetical protein